MIHGVEVAENAHCARKGAEEQVLEVALADVESQREAIAANLMQLYIYRQFISGISVSLDESAMLDGCGYFRIFAQIIFPLLTPATATLVIIKTVSIVNDMYIPYLYMPKNQNKTLTTFLMRYAGAQQNSWPLLAAGIIVVALPTVLLYVFFQKYIIEGITAGAVKE